MSNKQVTRINFEEGAEIHIGPIPANQNISAEVLKDLNQFKNHPEEIRSIERQMQRGELPGVFYNEKSKMYEYEGKTPEQKEESQMLALKSMHKTAETVVAVRQKYIPEQSEFQIAAKPESLLPPKEEIITKTEQDFKQQEEERRNLRFSLGREMNSELLDDIFNHDPPFTNEEIEEISQAIRDGEIEGIEKRFDDSVGREVFAYKGENEIEIEENRNFALADMTRRVIEKDDANEMRAKYGLNK